jgi:hypothetical protein
LAHLKGKPAIINGFDIISNHFLDGINLSGLGLMAIASGNQVTSYGDVEGNYRIKKITDINNDGINEILLEDSWTGQGRLTVWNRFLEIRPRGIFTLARFETYEDNTGAGVTYGMNGINYKASYEAKAKVYYTLGTNNQLSSLRSDWMIRKCGFGSSYRESECTAFESLFSYNIPLHNADDNEQFFNQFERYFKPWIERICRNVCERL